MSKKTTQHIDERIAKRIQELHKKHSQLGAGGLGKLLESEGIRIDEKELKSFLKTKKFSPGATTKIRGGSADPTTAFGAGLTKPGEGIGR